MATILNRLVERLDNKIARLRIAKIRLLDKNLEDKKLDHQLKRLISIRNRLKSKSATGGGDELTKKPIISDVQSQLSDVNNPDDLTADFPRDFKYL